MLDLIHRERAVRGDVNTGQNRLPWSETWEALDWSVECGFTTGRVVGQRGRQRWNCRTDSPNAAVSGTTGAGKSQLLGQWAPLPDLWNAYLGADWGETWIFDPKGTGIYRAAQNLGAVLIDDMADMVEALHELHADVRRRNKDLGQMKQLKVDASGLIRSGAEVSIWNLSPEQRAELDLRPRFVVFDELADLIEPNPDDYPKGFNRSLVPALVAGFGNVARKARSAGVPLAIGNQRFDVRFVGGGIIREQFASRIVLGKVTNDHYRMMFSEADAKRIPPETRALRPGHGWSDAIGGLGLSRMYVCKVKLENYEPPEFDEELEGVADVEVLRPRFKRYVAREPEDDDVATPQLDQQAAQAWAYLAEHGPSTRRQVADGTGIPLKTLQEHLLNEKHGRARHRRLFVETVKGRRGVASIFDAAPGASPPDDHFPVGGKSEGGNGGARGGGWQFGFGVVHREGRWWGWGQDCRAVLTGWAVRWFLYLFAFRLLWGPAHAGANTRDPRVVRTAHAQGNGRCHLCGRAGELDVHHVRPRSFGGADVVENTWLLCKRPGKPSCHQATTNAEAGIRRIRRITATLDGAPAPALHKRVTPWLAVVHPDQAFFSVLFLVGLLGGLGLAPSWGYQALALWAIAVAVPWAYGVVRHKERMAPNHKASQKIDPGADQEVYAEKWHALQEKDKWWARHRLRKQNRKTKRAKRKAIVQDAAGSYCAGYLAPMVLPWVPAILFHGLGVFL